MESVGARAIAKTKALKGDLSRVVFVKIDTQGSWCGMDVAAAKFTDRSELTLPRDELYTSTKTQSKSQPEE